MPRIDLDYQPTIDESYMNEHQLAYFRHHLSNWRNRLNNESRLSRQRLLENEPDGGDILDQSVKDSNRAMDLLSRSRQQRLIQQIDAALSRMEDGSFGYCLESGEEIGIKRLLAYPIATLSVEAQEQLEKRRRSHAA